MITAYLTAKKAGLQNVKLGNIGVFAKTETQIQTIIDLLGPNSF